MFSLNFENVLEVIRSAHVIDLVTGLAVIGALRVVYLANRKRPGTTRLKGPSCGFFGAEKVIHESPNPTAVYEAWCKEYGVAYEIPLVLGERSIVLCDPKAVAHVFGRDSWSYALTEADKVIIARSVRVSSMYRIFLHRKASRLEKVLCGPMARFTKGIDSASLFMFSDNTKVADLRLGSGDPWHQHSTRLLFESYRRFSMTLLTR